MRALPYVKSKAQCYRFLGFCSLSASSDALQMFHTISLKYAKYVVLINLLIVFVLMLIIYMFN